MSSAPNHQPKPATGREATAEDDSKVESTAPDDTKSSQRPTDTSYKQTTKVNGSEKAADTNSGDADDPQPSGQGNDSQSDVASATSNATQPGGRPTRSKTRSNTQSNSSDGQPNGDKRYADQESSTNTSSSEDEGSTFLDALASTLARLDEDAYKRALLRDANSLLENVVIPMSFPWVHRIAPVVKNIPRDIDEMPAIQTIEDAEHEMCALKNGNFDLPQDHFGDERKGLFDDEDDLEDFRAVARRADEPGVIELVTCVPRTASQNPSPDTPAAEGIRSVLLKDPLVELTPIETNNSSVSIGSGANATGDLLYDIFEQEQAQKRRKLEAGMARLKTLMVSVRVGSTSSRASLLNKSSEQEKLPLLLPALLPQDFRAMAKYKSTSRIPAGRSQLTWLEKASSVTSHRTYYRSYLTHEKIEPGLHKRPREVSVGIRVNGGLLTSAQITADQLTLEALASSSKRKRADGKAATIYAQKIVTDALKDAHANELGIGKRQCSLDTEEYIKMLLSREQKIDKSSGWNEKVTIERLNLVYVEPRIDCLPSEDGLFHVVCTSPGELQPSNVEAILNDASKRGKAPVCTVCWRETSVTGESVTNCSDCGVCVHVKSCQSSPPSGSLRRKCVACSEPVASSRSRGGQKKAATASPTERSSRRSSRTPSKSKEDDPPMSEAEGQPTTCALCPHAGGAMSKLKRGGKTVWAHDVCRLWCDQATELPQGVNRPNSAHKKQGALCALCGTSSSSDEYNGIAKCAASGCSVYFHPMCALYLFKCQEVSSENLSTTDSPKEEGKNDETETYQATLDRIVEEDNRLCKLYSLKFAMCSIPEKQTSKRTSSSTAVIPVCFCGIHNPNRDRSLYGLYAGGVKKIGKKAMRIPPNRVGKKSE